MITLQQALHLLGEALDFIKEECVENYPGERLPDSFAQAAYELTQKISKALTEQE